MASTDTNTKEEIVSKSEKDAAHPPMYKVILHNDDYTTMEFVVDVLMKIFGKSLEKATEIMLNVHREGRGLCGTYTREIAETKVDTVHKLAREHGYPLKSTMEKE
ncbi:MAG: ATP-dependent Clp protease adapter ClpS [Desulfobacteraceae bacterium]